MTRRAPKARRLWTLGLLVAACRISATIAGGASDFPAILLQAGPCRTLLSPIAKQAHHLRGSSAQNEAMRTRLFCLKRPDPTESGTRQGLQNWRVFLGILAFVDLVLVF